MKQIKIFRLSPVQGIGKADKNVEAEVNEFLATLEFQNPQVSVVEDRIIVTYTCEG